MHVYVMLVISLLVTVVYSRTSPVWLGFLLAGLARTFSAEAVAWVTTSSFAMGIDCVTVVIPLHEIPGDTSETRTGRKKMIAQLDPKSSAPLTFKSRVLLAQVTVLPLAILVRPWLRVKSGGSNRLDPEPGERTVGMASGRWRVLTVDASAGENPSGARPGNS